MIISTSRKTPKLEDLVGILKEEFSDQYSYKIFGPGCDRSIIVRKSVLVGVQLTQRGNEIVLDSTFPSIVTSFFSALISIAGIWLTPTHSYWRGFENEMAVFLRLKYA